MERIDLHNYEAFFLDHLEGNLSEQGQAELSMFLSENPQLIDELNEMADISDLSLSASLVQMNTESLKANPDVLSALTVDDWMIASVEGELSVENQKLLNDYVAQNGLEHAYKVYQKTIVSPNLSSSFGSTADLKRKEGLVIPFYLKWIAAAAIIFLIANTIDFSSNEESISNSEVIAASSTFNKRSRIDFNTRSLNFATQENKEIQNSFEIKSDDLVADFVIPEPDVIDTIDQLIVPEIKDDPIVNNNPPIDTSNVSNPNLNLIKDEIPNEEIVANTIPTKENEVVTEEPFKLITKTTANLINREVSFTRDRKKDSDEYTAYHIKIGRFEFDRKKSK